MNTTLYLLLQNITELKKKHTIYESHQINLKDITASLPASSSLGTFPLCGSLNVLAP